MAGANMPHRRPLPDRHGDPACAIINLVAPLAHEATDRRIAETAGDRRDRPGAVSEPIGADLRLGDVDSATDRSTRATTRTPGPRTSATATRTTTTRTTSSGPAPSADRYDAGPTFAQLVRAYFDCRRSKRNSYSALTFERDLEHNLVALYDDLVGGTYRPDRSICFVVTRPKPREVWAAAFRDRVVHHLLYNYVAPCVHASFIADSCACIPGRGTLYAARRLEARVRSQTQNWSQPSWYLKCDLANFFVAIDKRILREQLRARIHEPWWLALAEQILMHDPRSGATIQSTSAAMARVPAHKSLLNQPAHRGLPIGNLSSQFFANVYLDALDQFVKHRIGARHYIRYVDDFVLLHESPQWLNDTRGRIEAFLAERLHAQLNPRKTILQPIDRGIDFVGQVIKPWRRSIRRRTVSAAIERITAAGEEDLLATANSYFGLLRQASASHHDRARMANRLRSLGRSVDHVLIRSYRVRRRTQEST